MAIKGDVEYQADCEYCGELCDYHEGKVHDVCKLIMDGEQE